MYLEKLLEFFYIVSSRYFIIAGVFFVIFYVFFSKRFENRRLQNKKHTNQDYKREILYSVITIIIFSAIPVFFLTNSSTKPYTTLYTEISEQGWWYFFILFPIMFLIHDTYFYWFHRLMHHPKLFKLFHLVHHKSTNPSPWTAYSFHPLEAVIESGIFVVFIFAFPVHPIHLFIFFLLMFIYNVYGHLGYELYPKNFNKNWLGKWINTSVAHNMHHQYFKGNYGLYFMFWDRWMNTVREDYDTKYEKSTLISSKKNSKIDER